MAAIACCGVTSARVQETQDNFCRDHYLYHATHSGEAATLDVEIADNNELSGSLLLPANAVAGQQIDRPGAIIVVGDGSLCAQTRFDTSTPNGALRASFTLACDGSDVIKLVNVRLFDSAPLLDEAVVTIVTPATMKHFAISRRCSAPIFRLQQRQEVTR